MHVTKIKCQSYKTCFWYEKETKSINNDFKHLLDKFSGNLLELVKQKGAYTCKYMDSSKKVFWWQITW